MKLSKQRMEAFSDGVIAIIITIMVLNIPLPGRFDFNGIMELLISISIYFVSFVVVGAFWNQHHKIFNYIEDVTHNVVWINLLFLFFLSLIPIFTKWVMENPKRIIPVIGYDIVYLFVNLSYMLMFTNMMHNSKSEEIKLLFNKREEGKKQAMEQAGRSDLPSRLWWLRFMIIVAVIAGTVAVSIVLPGVATVILLGLPVFSSATGLLFDRYKHRQKRINT